jgi:hypothetical protein
MLESFNSFHFILGVGLYRLGSFHGLGVVACTIFITIRFWKSIFFGSGRREQAQHCAQGFGIRILLPETYLG